MNEIPPWLRTLPLLVAMAFGILMPFAMVGVAVYFLKRRKANVESELTRLADSLGGRLQSSPLNALPVSRGKFKVQGRHGGMSYALTYRSGREMAAPLLILTIPVKPPFRLTLRKESLDTRLSKRIGMASELVTGIDDFDDEYFIQTSDEVACRKFLSVSEHRDAIRAIHQLGFQFTFDRRVIRASRPVRGSLDHDDMNIAESSEVAGLLNAVACLVAGLQRPTDAS